MKSTILRSASLVGVVSLLTPATSWAHAAHGPEHGWLAGAAQPLLGLDHLLAGALVALGVGCALWCLAQVIRARSRSTPTTP